MDQNEMRLRRETRNQEAVAMAALLLAQPTPPTQQERDWLLSLYTGVGGLVKAEPGSGLFADSKAAEGQYLTPLAVTSFMAEALAIPAGAEVYDNCMGSGRMFYGVPDTCRLVGIELQEEAYRIATAVYKDWPGGTEFFQGDCLEYRMATGELDYALGNPPFGLTWSTEDLAHLDTASTHKGHVLSQKAATELQIRAVRPGGLIGLVVPQGIFGRSDLVTFREWVLTRCLELARIMLPKQTFEESGTNWPCAIWLLKKHDPQVQGPLDMLRDQPFQATIDTWDWRSQRAKLADAVLDEWRLSTWYVHHVVPYARKVRMQRERAADSLPPGLVTPPQPQPTRSSLDEPTPFDDASFDDASFDDVSFNDDGPVLALRAYPLPPGRSYQLAAGPDGAAITPAHIGHAPAAPADKSAAAVPLNLAPTGEYVITGRPKWKTKQGRTILVGQVTVTGPDGRRHAVFAVGANEFWCSCQTAGCPAVAAVVATRNGKGAKKEPAQIATARPPAAKPTEPPARVSEPVEPPTNVPAVSVKWRPRKLGDAPHLSDDELKLRRARRDEWQRQHARQLAEHPEVILARVFANDEAGQALLKEHAEAWRNREDIRVGWWKAGRFS
ncbi:MAG: SAM-dependent methyltransferase, partial [Chloroflexi bacterium]|nr:SAM-dependent methyltransferase [Chloroflexota bacterium]